MNVTRAVCYADFRDMSNEDLIGVHRVLGSKPAMDVLMQRCLALVIANVADRAKHWPEDANLDEAVQVALLASWRASGKFDLVQEGRPRRCRFRSYAIRAIRNRLNNFGSRKEWRMGHADQDISWEIEMDRRAELLYEACWDFLGGGQGPADPVRNVILKDLVQRLHEFAKELDAKAARVLEDRLASRSMAETAKRLGMSKSAVFRAWRRVEKMLRRRFGLPDR